MSVEREPIKFPEGETSPVYVANLYHKNRPNRNERYLLPYFIDVHGAEACYFPLDSFGRSESKLSLTRTLMETCVDRGVPMVVETNKPLPEWAMEMMGRVRGSVWVVQIPTLNVTMKRRFFSSAGSTDILREQILTLFQTGTNIRLKFAPLIPTVTKLSEMMEFMVMIKSFISGVDIAFSRLTLKELKRIEKRNRIEKGELVKLYDEVDDEYFLKDEVKVDMVGRFKDFCEGNSIPVVEY